MSPSGFNSGAIQVLLALLVAIGASAQAQSTISLRERMLLAEDTRAQSSDALEPLRQGLKDRDPKLRRQAVRGIGRLERAELIPLVTPTLADDNADVRGEAANAVGQLARGEKGVADAKSRLLVRARVEQDPRVWGVVAATLGRLAYTTAADVDQVEQAIARPLPGSTSTAIQIDAVLGATEGLEALARQSGKIAKLKPATISGLRAASQLEGRKQDAEKLARIRRLATLALVAAGAATRSDLERGIADADEEVRRLTMVAARADIEGREVVIRKGLADASPRVRFEALQTWGRQFLKTSCEPIADALRDSNPHVSLHAMDLAGSCADNSTLPLMLRDIADKLSAQPQAWHAPAHALVSLARSAPDTARKLLPRFAAHPIWQVRMYAARAAGQLALADHLATLMQDSHHNVREAALSELAMLKHPDAERFALESIKDADYQLVMTAARVLATAAEGERAMGALTSALGRITAERRQTSRDARMAILDAIEKLTGPASPERRVTMRKSLGVYLTDTDPVITRKTTQILQVAEGLNTPRENSDATGRIPLDELDALAKARVRVSMADRGVFELRLLPDEAPVTSWHFATLAREGYYNGLTFHRVAPNFVIQGGGPGANEYSGQGPFMRDEVGLVSHRRGTVGISTRGRDTGDAQIFINLVDSPRLDHTYTVFAEVTQGMEVVDAILEGDVIERIAIAYTTR